MSFIKDIRVANILLAAYFIISADGILVNITRKLFNIIGLYRRHINSFAFEDSTPITTRSGLIKSFIAAPSFRNSGLDATSKSIEISLFFNSSCIVFLIFCAVPTGTVDFVTSNIYLFMKRPTVRATSKTYDRSALPSSSGGVPTALKTISISFKHVVKSVENFKRPS